MIKISVFVILISILILCSAIEIDLAWEEPEISSANHSSVLQKNDEKIDIYPFQSDKPDFYCALQNWQTLQSAVAEFITSTGQTNSFFSYHARYEGNQEQQAGIKKTLSSLYDKLLSENKKNSGLDLNLFTGYDLFSRQDERYSFFYYGVRLSGNISKDLFFYTNFWAGHFSGDEAYLKSSSLIDSWTQRSDDSTLVYLDNVSGKLLYQVKPYWSLAIGRGKYELGNNIGGSIILNDDCNDFGYLSTKFDFSKFYLHFIHASLIADSTKTGYKDYPDKYLATHKFGWKPDPKLEIFWGEHVVYGDRSIDPSYLIPFTYWRGTEHNLGDRDNVLIFGGVNYRPFKRDLMYFNVIFDEFSKSKILKNWWGNKYAVQIGNSCQLSANKQNRATLEFTAVRPWLYTHKYIQNKFSHDGIGLGFPLGSNLLNYALEINWEFRKNLSGNLHASYTRQGSVGNDFSINYENRDKNLDNDTHWLEGDITDHKKLRFIVDWKPLAHHRFRFGFSTIQTDDADYENELSLSYQASY